MAKAFSGGPLGVGWAPWVIGVAALGVGIFVFTRSPKQAQATAVGATPSVNFYPSSATPANASNISSQQISSPYSSSPPDLTMYQTSTPRWSFSGS